MSSPRKGFWHFLPESLTCVIEREVIEKEYKKGEYLFHMGEPPKGLFFLFEGLVGLFSSSDTGKEHLLRIFGSGQCLGHRSLMAQENHHAGAKLLENSRVGFVSKEKTLSLLKSNPEFAENMMRKLAIELRKAEERLAGSAEKQVAARVAEAMIYLKETYPDHRWTRSEIAYYCGSTTPTVIRTLADFEKKGWIQQSGRDISIQSLSSLEDLAGI